MTTVVVEVDASESNEYSCGDPYLKFVIPMEK